MECKNLSQADAPDFACLTQLLSFGKEYITDFQKNIINLVSTLHNLQQATLDKNKPTSVSNKSFFKQNNVKKKIKKKYLLMKLLFCHQQKVL